MIHRPPARVRTDWRFPAATRCTDRRGERLVRPRRGRRPASSSNPCACALECGGDQLPLPVAGRYRTVVEWRGGGRHLGVGVRRRGHDEGHDRQRRQAQRKTAQCVIPARSQRRATSMTARANACGASWGRLWPMPPLTSRCRMEVHLLRLPRSVPSIAWIGSAVHRRHAMSCDMDGKTGAAATASRRPRMTFPSGAEQRSRAARTSAMPARCRER